MKQKKQNQVATDDDNEGNSSFQQDDGGNGTTNTYQNQLTDTDRENGNFKKFAIPKAMTKKLKARQVEFLYPVQAKSFATIHEQKDCIVQAPQGSGKTLAYVIPLTEWLENGGAIELEDGRAPRVVVVVPTRDGTKQVSDEFQSLVNSLTVATIYPSKKKSDSQDAALSSGCDILIATPDRLKECLEQSKFDATQVKHVVFDQMDQMLDSTVMDDLKTILKHMFSSAEESKAQLIIFSETIPDAVRKLTKKYLSNDCATIDVAKEATKEETEANEDEEDEDDDEPMKTSSGLTNKTKGGAGLSLLTQQPNYTTYMLSVQDELRGAGIVFSMLRKCFGDDFDGKAVCAKVAFTKDYKSAVFELPSNLDEQLQSYWKDSPRIQMGPITELPDLDESSMQDSNSYSRGGNKPARGGGGGGNRNSGRSNACFKCQKEGHKSFECPEGGQSYQNGGNKSAGGCFNCGKDGHKSFECPEPKKAGGRGGGERSNACFNCGQEGHKSFECTEPKKAGGRGGGGGGGERSNACFNCGKDGHKSFECPEPKKPRGSGGPGGRGGRGGGAGGRGGGAKRYFNNDGENGHANTETSNKKIKFDDDDDE